MLLDLFDNPTKQKECIFLENVFKDPPQAPILVMRQKIISIPPFQIPKFVRKGGLSALPGDMKTKTKSLKFYIGF